MLFAPSGKGRKRAKKADFSRFPGRAARRPLSPHLLHPHLRHPNSRGLPAPGSKKCPKQSQNSLRSLKIDCFETPETVLRLFRTLFAPRGRKAPGDSFETLSGLRARRARETPVRGGRGCKSIACCSLFFLTEKGHFRRDTGWVSQRHPAIQRVFRNFMWFFLMCLFSELIFGKGMRRSTFQ